MILIDTNVVSEMMRRRPNPKVAEWFASKEPHDLAISSATIFELRFGAAILPLSPERDRLSMMIDRLESRRFGKIVSLDEAAAVEAAAFRALRRSLGRPVGVPDSLIAGTALGNKARLATRNTRDFAHAGLDLVDPFETLTP